MKLNLISAEHPKWSNAEQTRINLTVRFVEINEDLPFTASPDDSEEHGRDIYARAAAGAFGAVGEYVAPIVPVVVPVSVPMRQAREALIRRGQFAAVNNHINAMDGVSGDIARNEWEKSQVVSRYRPLTIAMFQLIGVNTEADRDEWFTYASTL